MNLILPDVSVIIGLVYGSHEAILISASSSLPLLTSRVAPYGTLYCSVILPLASSIIHSAFLEITTCNLSLFITVLISSENLTVPEFLLYIALSSEELEAAPPIWKVRIVNWVPGSPID